MYALTRKNGKRAFMLAMGVALVATLTLVYTRGAIDYDQAATTLFILVVTGLAAFVAAYWIGGRGRKA